MGIVESALDSIKEEVGGCACMEPPKEICGQLSTKEGETLQDETSSSEYSTDDNNNTDSDTDTDDTSTSQEYQDTDEGEHDPYSPSPQQSLQKQLSPRNIKKKIIITTFN